MKLIEKAAFLLLTSSLAQSALAQATVPEKHSSSSDPVAISTSAKEAGAQQKRLAILRVQGLIDHALGFHDAEARIYTVVSLGDVLWKYDDAAARQAFLKAFDLLKKVEVAEGKGAASAPAEGRLTAARLADLRDELISSLARHDAALARRFSDAASFAVSESDRALSDQNTAMSLLVNGNPARAVEFAERSLGGGVTQQMISFLLQLRRRDEAQADELYLRTLNRLLTEPRVDGMRLMETGVYVFTSPFLDAEMEASGAVVYQSVGNVGVVNLSADRPGISPLVVNAYLSAASQILSRPVADSQQQKLYYAAGRQLLPKAQRFAPALAPRIAAAIQTLIPSVPAALAEDSTYEELGPKSDYTFDDTLREIDEINDPVQHDVHSVMIVNGLCFSGDFARARLVTEKIKDPAIRVRVINLVASGDAAKTLEKGDAVLAEEMINKLTPGIERSILWLALARSLSGEGAQARATEAINASLKDARRLDDVRKPFVILSASEKLAPLDTVSAIQTFNEAVKLLNAGDGKSPRWSETVEVGGRPFSFNLRGAESDILNSATRRLYSVDAQGTEGVIRTLRHERILGKALRAFAESILASIPTEK